MSTHLAYIFLTKRSTNFPCYSFDFLPCLFVFLIFCPNVFFPSNCVVFDWTILGFWWDIQYKHISISNCRKLSKNRGIARFQKIKLHVIYQTFQNISINLEAQNGKAFWSISYVVQQVFIALINIILSDENPFKMPRNNKI